MISVKSRKRLIAIGLCGFLVFTAVNYQWLKSKYGIQSTDKLQTAIQMESETYYTCPMHPMVKSKIADACPVCGMDLIAIHHDHKHENTGSVILDDRKRQLIGVTTSIITEQVFTKTIKTAGKVDYDEVSLTEITLKYNAWIETLNVNDVGVSVKQGQPLFSVYSPDLISAQQEYLMSLKVAGQYKQATRQRLEFWGVNANQLTQLKSSGRARHRLAIISPVSGVIIQKNIIRGSAVKAGQALLRIADLSTVWVEANLYQNELAWVKPGMTARIVMDDLPGQEWLLPVIAIDPFLDTQTHSARMKFKLENKQGLLRADMYASVYMQVDMGKHVLVPESAVIFSGEKRIVFVDKGQGQLQPQEITTGLQNDAYIQVLTGLKVGDKVVTSGQFLIASESKLKSGISQW